MGADSEMFKSEVVILGNQRINLRLLEPTDTRKLSEYLNQLSATTRQFFAPHPFDEATITAICSTLNPAQLVRLVATGLDNEQIISYSLLMKGAVQSDTRRLQGVGITVDQEMDCSLAPSIADAYQSQGLGKHIMEKMLAIARSTNKKRILLWGGVQVANQRAVSYYQTFGFVVVNEFERNGLNYDMALVLKE